MGNQVFMQGNQAMAESAIRAGCKLFFGYPITPSSEVPEYYARAMRCLLYTSSGSGLDIYHRLRLPDLMECGSSLGDIDPLAVIVGAANAADAKLRSQFSRVVVVDGICPALILKCRKDRPILLRSGRRASTCLLYTSARERGAARPS